MGPTSGKHALPGRTSDREGWTGLLFGEEISFAPFGESTDDAVSSPIDESGFREYLETAFYVSGSHTRPIGDDRGVFWGMILETAENPLVTRVHPFECSRHRHWPPPLIGA